jgi:iron complex transport system ATP-binding protein
MSGLIVEDASFGYSGRPVLRHISLQVDSGEVLAVVGPNGVGKSTLIKAVSGIIPLTSGRIFIEGRDLAELNSAERARRVAVVPQAIHLPPAFTVRQVVLAGRTPYLGWFDRESSADLGIAWQAMEQTATDLLADRLIGELSGGEQQRVLIARALAQRAPVMLLDEPTAHLDLRHQEAILNLLQRLTTEHRLAVMLALHDLNLVARIAHRVALLSDGQVHRLGLPAAVLTPEELAPVYGVAIQVISHPANGRPIILAGAEPGRGDA